MLITDPYSNDKIVGIINQALHIEDDNQLESLLQPHQARSFGTLIDDVPRHHLGIDGKAGTQCVKVPGHVIPLLHDGWKTYFLISKPSKHDFNTYPVVELTSATPYNPSH